MSVETKKPDDITHRLRCKYPLGPIQANGEPEFGWRDFSGPIETMLPTSLMLEAADRIDAQTAELERLRQPWISVAERLPEPGLTVFVYSPPQPDDWPDSVRIEFDAIDPESDGESWVNHSAHYEHFCCVAKGGMDVPMTGPSEKAPYTHWMPVPAIPSALSGEPT